MERKSEGWVGGWGYEHLQHRHVAQLARQRPRQPVGVERERAQGDEVAEGLRQRPRQLVLVETQLLQQREVADGGRQRAGDRVARERDVLEVGQVEPDVLGDDPVQPCRRDKGELSRRGGLVLARRWCAGVLKEADGVRAGQGLAAARSGASRAG